MIGHPGADMVIGLDLGTTACKAVALDAGGKVAASAAANYPVYAPQSGWAEQDVDEIFTAAAAALCKLAARVERSILRGLSLSGAMHSLQQLDGKDCPIRRAQTWADQRAATQVDKLRA